MTEKRFTYKHFDWLQWHIYKDGEFFIEVTDCEEDAKKLCDVLNELHEENKQLQNDCSILVQSNQEYRKENEQLKSENNMLKTTIGRNEAYIKKLTETSEWHC